MKKIIIILMLIVMGWKNASAWSIPPTEYFEKLVNYFYRCNTNIELSYGSSNSIYMTNHDIRITIDIKNYTINDNHYKYKITLHYRYNLDNNQKEFIAFLRKILFKEYFITKTKNFQNHLFYLVMKSISKDNKKISQFKNNISYPSYDSITSKYIELAKKEPLCIYHLEPDSYDNGYEEIDINVYTKNDNGIGILTNRQTGERFYNLYMCNDNN